MYILVDDQRTLGADIICRNYNAAIQVLKDIKTTNEICLGIDFDLGEDKTGEDVVKFALENNCCPAWVQIVSMNPVGRKRITDLLIDHGYQHQDQSNLIKFD
jgi:microsomal dipeptidase-like Zn-dependent dipeptidase